MDRGRMAKEATDGLMGWTGWVDGGHNCIPTQTNGQLDSMVHALPRLGDEARSSARAGAGVAPVSRVWG